MKRLVTLLAIPGIALLASCSKTDSSKNPNDLAAKAAADSIKHGEGHGMVMSIDSAHRSVQLAHDEVPGIMDAMTMDYRVANPPLLDGIMIGDSVIFTLTEPQIGDYVVTKIAPFGKRLPQ